MLIHTVIFWLRKDLTHEDLALFEQELCLLEKIPTVEQLFIGRPSATAKRPVIDDSYDFCLTVALKDLAAHDVYQEDPLHLAFIKNCSHMWERVKIYDAD
jgi:hypothetical protein